MVRNGRIEISTRGRGTYDITDQIVKQVRMSDVDDGLCTLWIHHTSASLIVCENADPTVRSDLEAFAARLVPDGDAIFDHTAEGPDDMPAHVRSVLTQTSLSIPIVNGSPVLGTWQGVYLWEHRTHPHARRITVSILS